MNEKNEAKPQQPPPGPMFEPLEVTAANAIHHTNEALVAQLQAARSQGNFYARFIAQESARANAAEKELRVLREQLAVLETEKRALGLQAAKANGVHSAEAPSEVAS